MPNVKIFTDNIDQKSRDQINTLVELPAFAESKIRIMPDVHAGAGCVIGFTADLGKKVIPNIVGVDIGCGMFTVNIGRPGIDFDALDKTIRYFIPSGMNVHDSKNIVYACEGAKAIMEEVHDSLHVRNELRNMGRIDCSMGTLGGGNHFIEVDVAEDGTHYLVIHSGSRNLGKQVADLYQQKAIDMHSGSYDPEQQCDALVEKLKAEGRHSEINSELAKLKKDLTSRKPSIPPALCWLEGELAEMYLHDMDICQRFAVRNRMSMAKAIIYEMGFIPMDMFQTIHNYIDHESGIVRKGAISAKAGEKLLIPINMRDGSIIGHGKGNDDWNQSAPHGAGRLMSRMEAKRKLNLAEFENSMTGVFTTSVSADTLDEAPMVYKPMDDILSRITPTVDVQEVIRPVYNFKASE